MSRTFGNSILVNLVCLALVASCSWSFYKEAHPTPVNKNSSINYLSAKSESRLDSITESEVTPAPLIPEPEAAEPIPVQETAALPQPEPTLTEWVGDPLPAPMPNTPGSVLAISKIMTDQPVVFLTLDDGWVKSPAAHDWLLAHRLPFTLFLTDEGIKNDYNYFIDLQNSGMVIEDHTISHPDMATLNFEQQKAQICGPADIYTNAFGVRPTLFRPPYGSFNEQTRQAAAACGMKALILWSAKVNGGSIQFQNNNTHLLPGDIVLMHFRDEFLADIKAFTDQAVKDNLQVGRLEDWIQ
jgi:peptidoglycan/xylan/chitin deacetylase (PgdA/CDA1 family)